MSVADTESAEFSLIYNGKALDTGSMRVADLAPALQAVQELFDEAALADVGSFGDVKVSVRSGFRRGSFVVDLLVSGELWRDALEVFSGPKATAIANMLALVGIPGGIGLFQLIKRLRGRKPTRIIQITETRTTRIEIEGSDSIEIPEKVWKLFNRRRARDAAYKVVRPLLEPGIETVEVETQGRRENLALEGDVQAFEPQMLAPEGVSTDERRVLQLVSVSFRNGNKWRVTDGGRTIYVNVADEAFLRRVELGEEKFGSNDFLDVTLTTTQRIDPDGLRSEYSITKVHKHSASAEQLLFPFRRT